MTTSYGRTRQAVQFRVAVLLVTGAGLAALLVVGAGLALHAGYVAWRERARPVSLMVLDDGSVVEAPAPAPLQALTAAGEADDADDDATEAPPAPVVSLPSVRPSLEQPPARGPALRGQPMFDGRPIRKVASVRMLVTAYSPDKRSCGPNARGITASGKSVWTNAMRLVAADTRLLPFGSLIAVPGYHAGKPVPVLDRGGAIKGRRLDVLFPTHEEARAWGKRYITVTVWDYAD